MFFPSFGEKVEIYIIDRIDRSIIGTYKGLVKYDLTLMSMGKKRGGRAINLDQIPQCSILNASFVDTHWLVDL